MTGTPQTGWQAAVDAAMRRAITLSEQGPARGLNPQVGCVVLDDAGNTLAEGWHMGSGTPHAEVAALSKISAEDARGATFVVTLEPCNHTGKTGPCADALIAAGVGRVIYAVSDPGERSSGGADKLRAAGIEVVDGLLADEVTEHIGSWLTAARLRRPHVTVKWAASLDGRIAAADGTSQWISGTLARERVHEQRAAADAIVVGTGTVLADNPTLTARRPEGTLYTEQPIPVVLGERSIPESALITTHPQPLIHATHRDVPRLLAELYAQGIRSVYVEGGPTVASAFIASGLVDRYYVFSSPVLLGGGPARDMLAVGDIGVQTLADAQRLHIERIEQLGSDIFITAHPRKDA